MLKYDSEAQTAPERFPADLSMGVCRPLPSSHRTIRSSTSRAPAAGAARAGHRSSLIAEMATPDTPAFKHLRFLAGIGRLQPLLNEVKANPELLMTKAGPDSAREYTMLLGYPSLLHLQTIHRWLSKRLAAVVGDNPDEARLDLVANRGDLLAGLCNQHAVDEATRHENWLVSFPPHLDSV